MVRMLIVKTVTAHLALLAVMAVLAFGAAGTLNYWQAWIFLPVVVAPSIIVLLRLARRNPQLLTRRLSIGPMAEKEVKQKFIMLAILLGAISIVLAPGLEHRLHGLAMPAALSLSGDLLLLFGWYVFDRVFEENGFASSTIELAPDQQVVKSGPYAIVRHPMYSGALAMILGAPLALGSFWGFLGSLAIALALVWRIVEEERFLDAHLPGYAAYRRETPHRLVPRLW